MTYYKGPELGAYRALGASVRAARLRKGVSGAAIERELGLCHGMVSRIELGRHRSNVLVLVWLADYLGASMDDLTRDMMLPAEGND